MPQRLEPLARRIARVGKQLAARRERAKAEARREFRHMSRPMRRKAPPDPARARKACKRMIAYDLETSSIRKGTPRLKYLTACGADFWFSGRIDTVMQFAEILRARFLLDDLKGTRFVAWNGNRFDVYFVAQALLRSPEYILRPYLTRSKNLRGLRVIQRQFRDGVEVTGQKGVKEISWEFLDGISMTGMTGKPLKKFLATFAPDYMKLEGPNFGREEFSADNAEHVRYAERDSEGLYHALRRCEDITLEHFQIGLAPTIGNMGIKILQRHIPRLIEVWKPPAAAGRAIRDSVMRGGYCMCVRRYQGPVWKYDINQAYAAAMRDAWMPAGRCIHSTELNPYAAVYIARVRARNPFNRIPFYYRDLELKRSVHAQQEIGETWLTSIEVEQLQREKWQVEILEVWYWEQRFKLKEYVDKLEHLRIGEGRDPKSALGEIVKMIGNNSYGKTVEQLEGLELTLAAEQPEGYAPYPVDDEADPALSYVWYRFAEPMMREYHQPQIGAFITAQVRMVLRRVALLSPDTWLYADTDCVMFSDDQTDRLNIDPGKYGAWKIEESGEREYVIAAKKAYASMDGSTMHAKGMNVRALRPDDFVRWLAGSPPQQTQVQRQNFVKVMAGFDMFVERTRVGERM